MMTSRRHRLICWLLPTTSAIAGAATLLWLARSPLGNSAQLPGSAVQQEVGASPVATLESFEDVISLPLQRALIDSARAAELRPSAPSNPSLQLAGTIIEPGRSVALFNTPQKIEFRRVGEQIDSAQLVSIGRDSVEVNSNGRTITLKVQKELPKFAAAQPAASADYSFFDVAPAAPLKSQFQPPPQIADDNVIYVYPVAPATQPADPPLE